ncbi:MAG: MATE family efflux transporter [Myxococcales bacterium]|nr:MATE family efflux transporter [Myxococcales bacterium]
MSSSSSKQAPAPASTALSWEHSSLSHLLSLAWPIVVSMISYSTMTLVDTLFVGRIGPHALAGVGLGGIYGFILICFPMGLLGAVKILVSQAVGAGRPHRVAAFLGAGIWLGLGFGVVVVALGFAMTLIFPLFSATVESGQAASQYLAVRILGAPAYFVRTAVEQARIGLGDSRSPMHVAVVANLSNVLFDYLFIIELDQGVQGAGAATALSNLVGMVLMLGLQRREGFGLRVACWKDARAVLRLGIPSGAQFGLEVGGYAAMVSIVTYISEPDAAANQIAIQVLHFGFLPAMALGDAASVMAGQAVGAGRRDLVQQVAARSLIPTILYAALCSAVFLLGGRQIAAAFTNDARLIDLTVRLLVLAAIFQLADGVNIVARCVLRGTGDVRFVAWAGIALTWALTPPLTWFLGHDLGLGAVGGWLGLTAEVFIGAAAFWLRLRSNRWYSAADRSVAELHAG